MISIPTSLLKSTGRTVRRFDGARSAASSAGIFGPEKSGREIPGPKAFPIVGYVPFFMGYANRGGGLRAVELLEDQFEKYGNTWAQNSGIREDGEPEFVVTTSPDFLNVYENEGKHPTGVFDGSWPIRDFNRLEGGGIVNPFLSRGEAWREGRLAVNPHLFRPQAAKSYLDSINEQAAAASRNVQEFESDIFQWCKYASIDMFMSVALGASLNATSGAPRGRQFVAAAVDALGTSVELNIKFAFIENDKFKWLPVWKDFCKKWKLAKLEVHNLIEQESGKEHFQNGFIHKFMGSDKNITPAQAEEMVMLLLFAASDTTSAVLLNAITLLSSSPQVRERLRDEVRAELQGGDLHKESSLPYLDACISETNRVIPTLPWAVLRNIQEPCTVDGYRLERGTTIAYSAYWARTKIDDALSFRPERFMPEAVSARKGTRDAFLDHPINYMPFGFGARSCVGSRVAKLELRSALARLIQDWDWSSSVAAEAPRNLITRVTTTMEPSPQLQFTRL